MVNVWCNIWKKNPQGRCHVALDDDDVASLDIVDKLSSIFRLGGGGGFKMENQNFTLHTLLKLNVLFHLLKFLERALNMSCCLKSCQSKHGKKFTV
jgi:hypothetical protein